MPKTLEEIKRSRRRFKPTPITEPHISMEVESDGKQRKYVCFPDGTVMGNRVEYPDADFSQLLQIIQEWKDNH